MSQAPMWSCQRAQRCRVRFLGEQRNVTGELARAPTPGRL